MRASSNLKAAIADLISSEKAYNVASICTQYGLAEQGDDDPYLSKFRYVENRLRDKAPNELIALGRRLLEDYAERETFISEVDALEEALRIEAGPQQISEITRRELARALDQIGYCELGGQRNIVDLLNIVAPALRLYYDSTLTDEICRHMLRNQDWECEHLFERIGAYAWSDVRFLRMLEEAAHPLSRTGDEQSQWLIVINDHIHRDGFSLELAEHLSGHPIYRARSTTQSVLGRPKNLIFASIGQKPDIILHDAVNNDIQIIRHADLCLVYDEPFPNGIFAWAHLVDWWARREKLPESSRDAEESLYRRLLASVESSGSPPEKIFFRTYYSLRKSSGPHIPALVPQVYLHYDPATVHMLGGKRRVFRQRMDFLLLLGHGVRVVIEIDGRQHYADERGQAAPKRYGEMVAEDRRLKLAGYEIYRFGGHELQGESSEQLILDFFTALFARYKVLL